MRGALLLVAFVLAAGLASAQGAAPSDPVVIDSRDDWARFPGNGTAANPFVVDGIRIDLPERSTKVGLTIKDVPDHAIVRNVLVVGGRIGIVFEDSPNVRFEDVTVRSAETGIRAVNVGLRNVTVSGNGVGIVGEGFTVERAVVVNHRSGGIEGSNFVVNDSIVSGNPLGITANEGGVTHVRRTIVEGSAAIGIRVLNAEATVTNATLRNNGVGVYYAGNTDAFSVKGSNFGAHEKAAVEIVRPPTMGWEVDARQNYWGVGPDGKASAPSPHGFGSPLVGPARHAPFSAAPHAAAGPVSQPGAKHPGVVGPAMTLEEAQIVDVQGSPRINIRLKLEDPDGVANWTLELPNFTASETLRGETSVSVFRQLPLPQNSTEVAVRAWAGDLYGAIAAFNQTVAKNTTADEEEEDLPPPPPPENESPGPGALVPLAAAAWMARRRLAKRP